VTRRHTAGLERLSAADASNVVLDAPDQVNAFMLVGLLAPGGSVAEDGSVDLESVRAAVSGWAAVERRLAQRVRRTWRGLFWETVGPDPSAQVRLVDQVSGLEGLQAWCARLVVTPLPTDGPLWQLLVAPRVLPGRAAFVLRFHHAMVDGTAVVRLVEELLGAPLEQAPAPEPVEEPQDAGTRWAALASGVTRTVTALGGGSTGTALLGHLGPRRGIVFLQAPLGDLAAVATSRSGTVNDVLLAAVTAAAEATVEALGEHLPDEIRASVPVALPHRGGSGNAVGVMLVPLPTGLSDPFERLSRVSAVTRDAKADARRRGTFELTRTRLGSRLFRLLARHQRLVHLFVTNVPGPRTAVRIAGAPLVGAWPVAAIQGNVRLGVAAASYGGVLHISVHHDAAVPGRVFAERLDHELAVLTQGPGPRGLLDRSGGPLAG
jgi:diacylglycerol O-acyltransferase / wax synthase